MSPSTVAVVFGTRPEAVKLAPVIEALREQNGVETRIVATAQHRELLDQMLGVFALAPDVDLDLMRPGQTLDEVTARVLAETGKVLDRMKPALVIVQGDTTTVLAASLAAYYRKIPVGHVEAGLRSGDRYAPFPEEANRTLAGHLATLHFAPTERAASNLRREGVGPASIHVTGNPVVDAVRAILARTQEPEFPFLTASPPNLPTSKQLVLVTAHRRESFGQPLRDALSAIRRVAESRDDAQFVYPVHPNPNVRAAVAEVFGSEEVETLGSCEGRAPVPTSQLPNLSTSNIILIDPLEYIPFVHLMNRATVLLTDSGGIQEEGTALGKPVLVLREVTERPEAVECGSARLVGTDTATVAGALNDLLDGGEAYARMAQPRDVFGDGKAGQRIAEACAGWLRDPGL